MFDFEPPSSDNSGSDSEDDNDQNDKHLQIIEFVHCANLDKKNTDRLLHLLNDIHSNVGLPKSNLLTKQLYIARNVNDNYPNSVKNVVVIIPIEL